MNYYALMCKLTDNTAILTHGLNLVSPFNNWLDPVPWSIPVPEPLQIEVRSTGKMLPYYDNPIPVMTADLLETIRAAGVDNIKDYEVVINNPFDGSTYNEYRAINIIGAIKAIDEDLSESDELDESGGGSGIKFYDEIILDESKIHGALLFRLAEQLSYVVIAECIKDAILSKGNPEDFYFKPLFEESDD
ncbi:MAG: hypothetical protein JW982_09990 [Spirochaetes bacterium]|nr:hypothetical protein [Spirochaetota bacterium]